MSFLRACFSSPAHKLRTIGAGLALAVLAFAPPAWCQQSPATQPQKTAHSANLPQAPQAQTGSVTGQVVDQSGIQGVGAAVTLTEAGGVAGKADTTTDEDGRFVFYSVAAGQFELMVSFSGLTPQKVSGMVAPGQHFVTPLVMMVIPTQVTEVRVGVPPEELANEQIKQQEKQRVFGVVPNFYVSYTP